MAKSEYNFYCPNCEKLREATEKSHRDELFTSYGVVSPADFIQKMTVYRSWKENLNPLGQTVKTQLNIELDQDTGVWSLRIWARCNSCSFKFEHSLELTTQSEVAKTTVDISALVNGAT